MGYVLKPDEKEAIIHYVGLFGFISRYSSLANLFSGLSPEEAKARGMEPAYLMRWGWKHYNADIVHYDGIMKLNSLYEKLVSAAMKTNQNQAYSTVRLCSRKQIVLRKSVNHSFLSTSEETVENLVSLGYGNCPELAIIHFDISEEAIVLCMNIFDEVYPKPKEGEVLILPGMVIDASIDSNNSYDIHGLDGKKVQCYKAKVYGPDFSEVADLSNEDVSKIWDIALDTEMLKEIQIFVEKLNKSDVLPTPPSCYDKWVSAYKKMVMHSVYRKWKEYS